MTKTPDNVPSQPLMFTDGEIQKVREAIVEDPQLARDIVSSAKRGNGTDLRFIMDVGIVFFEDDGQYGKLITNTK